MTTQTRSKSPLDILRARIADAYVRYTHLLPATNRNLEIPIPLWVAEELKQALEKQ